MKVVTKKKSVKQAAKSVVDETIQKQIKRRAASIKICFLRVEIILEGFACWSITQFYGFCWACLFSDYLQYIVRAEKQSSIYSKKRYTWIWISWRWTIFIVLQIIYHELNFRILKLHRGDLEYDAAVAVATDLLLLVKLLYIFSIYEGSFTANGSDVLFVNGIYAQKSLIETKFLHNKQAKETWLNCHEYSD